MIRAPRFPLLLLLVLMQCLAPWLHAHSGVETGGFLHLPGLEFLAGTSGDCTMSDARTGETDLIVGMPAGKWDRVDGGNCAGKKHAPPALLAVAAPSVPPLPPFGHAPTKAPFAPFAQCRHTGCPRAPPLYSTPV